MKVISKDFHLVSNVELAKVLEERGSDSRGDSTLGSVSERKVHEYLYKISTADVDATALQGFIEDTKEFNLSRKEVLQVCHLVADFDIFSTSISNDAQYILCWRNNHCLAMPESICVLMHSLST